MQTQFTQTQVAETVAACIGKRLSLETLKTLAIDHGAETLRQFGEAVRARFADQFGHIVKPTASLAVMQKAKVPGVSTFYSYWCAVLKLQTKFEAGSVDAAAELAGLTTGKLTSAKAGAKGAKAKPAAKPEASEAPPLTVADCIGFLQAAHKAGALSAPDYTALQALIPAPVKSNVVDMGPAVEVKPLALAA